MRRYFFSLFLTAALLPLLSCREQPARINEEERLTDISGFIGHWSFDIEGDYVGWLGVRQEEDYLDADLLWKWGSVTPVANIFITDDGVLHVTRTRVQRRPLVPGEDAQRTHMVTNWMEAETDGERITGNYYEPRPDGLGVDSTWFSGVKLPDVPPAPDLDALEFGEPVELFNGEDLTGWELTDENQVNGFEAENGVLVNRAYHLQNEAHVNYGNLRTVDEWEDFNLTLEFSIPAGSNSGVYLRGMYEVQIIDSYGREPTDHTTGAVYSRIAPDESAEKPAGEWQSMDITLADRHVTVILNGVKIIDNEPVYGPTGGALQSDVFAPGPVFLQGDHGPVSFRNLVLTPIVD